MQQLISIIVPVYNVEDYLRRCLSSIINQTYLNIEIIVINDGSTDGSLKICEEFIKLDSRMRLYTKKNGGLSSARNFGLEKVLGEYIIFVDSDDYVTKDYVSNLYIAISNKNSDIAVSRFVEINEDQKIALKNDTHTLNIEYYNNTEGLKQLFLQKKFDNNAWGKIYKKFLFNNMQYPEGKLFEDIAITYKLFGKASKISYINVKDYYYVQRKNSIMNAKFNEKKLDLLPIVDDMFDDISNQNPELINYVGCRSFSSLINLWRNIPDDSEYRNIVWKKALNYRKYPLVNLHSKMKYKLGSALAFLSPQIVKLIIQNNSK